MEGHPNAFSKQTNCFSSPSARGTWSFLDRRKPPRKCRLKECSPGETWYTLICLGEMAPTFEPSRKTLTTPPSPIAGLRRWARPRPSRDAARTTTRVGNAGQIRFGARHNWMVAPTSSSMPSEVSPPLVAATTSDLSRSWFIVLSYTDRRKKNSNKLMKLRLRMLGRRGDHLRTPLNNPHRRARGCPLPPAVGRGDLYRFSVAVLSHGFGRRRSVESQSHHPLATVPISPPSRLDNLQFIAPVFEAQVRREAVMLFAGAPRACSLTWATAPIWFTGSARSTVRTRA